MTMMMIDDDNDDNDDDIDDDNDDNDDDDDDDDDDYDNDAGRTSDWDNLPVEILQISVEFNE